MALPLSEMTLEEALRSYSSVKGHRTRVEREIGKLLRLLKDQYSATSEESHDVALCGILGANSRNTGSSIIN